VWGCVTAHLIVLTPRDMGGIKQTHCEASEAIVNCGLRSLSHHSRCVASLTLFISRTTSRQDIQGPSSRSHERKWRRRLNSRESRCAGAGPDTRNPGNPLNAQSNWSIPCLVTASFLAATSTSTATNAATKNKTILNTLKEAVYKLIIAPF
jgi:hypothetical protein